MYGIFTYMSNQNGPNVGEYSIYGASGIYSIHIFRPSSIISHYFPESIFHSYFLLHGGFHEKKTTILVGSPFMEPPIFGPSIDYIHPLKIIYIYIPLCNPCHVCHIFSGILQLRPGPREGSVSRSRLTNSS